MFLLYHIWDSSCRSVYRNSNSFFRHSYTKKKPLQPFKNWNDFFSVLRIISNMFFLVDIVIEYLELLRIYVCFFGACNSDLDFTFEIVIYISSQVLF